MARVLNLPGNLYRSLGCRNIRCGNKYAVRCIIEAEMSLISSYKIHTAVDATIEGKIGSKRRYVFVKAVINFYGNLVIACFDVFINLEAETGIAADMTANLLSVNINFGLLVSAV